MRKVIEFGASWCGICQAARPLVEAMRQAAPDLEYEWVEDGPGQPLGRSYRVKLWPTLVFLRDGEEVARVVRPRTLEQLSEAADLLVGDAEVHP